MTIKANDTAVTFSDTLSIDGTAADITGSTVTFIMDSDDDAPAFSAAATIVDPIAGTVSYTPTAGFPTAPGTYKQEWQVTFPSGKILTFPSETYNKVKIIADLA